MTRDLNKWILGHQLEQSEYWHECELCGDLDDPSVHAPLSTGEVVCWRCAEQAGEFKVPLEHEWRVSQPY